MTCGCSGHFKLVKTGRKWLYYECEVCGTRWKQRSMKALLKPYLTDMRRHETYHAKRSD
jgi:uncharacterized Zn finger protein